MAYSRNFVLALIALVLSVWALVWALRGNVNTSTMLPAMIIQSGDQTIPYGDDGPPLAATIQFERAFDAAPLVQSQTLSLLSGQRCTDTVTALTPEQFVLTIDSCPTVGHAVVAGASASLRKVVRTATLADGTPVPAVLYVKDSLLYYQLGQNSAGTAWYDAAIIESSVDASTTWDLLIRSDGLPVVAYTLTSSVVTYRVGSDLQWSGTPTTQAWDVKTALGSDIYTACLSLLETASGTVQVFVGLFNGRVYCSAAPAFSVYTQVMNPYGGGTELTNITSSRGAGLPAVVVMTQYRDLLFVRANNADATSWPTTELNLSPSSVALPVSLNGISNGSSLIWVASAITFPASNPVFYTSTDDTGLSWSTNPAPLREAGLAIPAYTVLVQGAQLAVAYLWNSKLNYVVTTGDNVTADALSASQATLWDADTTLTAVTSTLLNQGPAVLLQHSAGNDLYYFAPSNDGSLTVQADYHVTYSAVGVMPS